MGKTERKDGQRVIWKSLAAIIILGNWRYHVNLLDDFFLLNIIISRYGLDFNLLGDRYEILARL